MQDKIKKISKKLSSRNNIITIIFIIFLLISIFINKFFTSETLLSLIINLLFLIIGLYNLTKGADYLVNGSSHIALSYNIKKIVIGLTLVAFGTSMPEFMVCLVSTLKGVDDVTIGNIVGSNIANILLVMGTVAIIRPLAVHKQLLKLDIPFLLGIIILFVIFLQNGILGRTESIILLVIFAIYMIIIFINAREVDLDVSDEKVDYDHLFRYRIKNIVQFVLGLAMLIGGGDVTIRSAVFTARVIGISELFIGLTVIALGTSLPELVTGIIAIKRNEDDITAGNIIGSNLFNTAFVLGIIPLIRPIKVSSQIIKFDSIFLLIITIGLAILIYLRKKINRLAGIIMLILYVLYILNIAFKFVFI